ncbi:unnamed protein product [Colias eurytheme]|nr:unnamed protein product [Colias eurytheme]
MNITAGAMLLYFIHTKRRMDVVKLATAYLNYPGFVLEHKFKPKAGVCAYIRDNICYQRLRNFENPDFSVLWLLVDFGADQIVYGNIYRSHTGDWGTTQLFQYLSEAADSIQQIYPSSQLVLLGDFNACHKDWLFPYLKTDHAGKESYSLAVSLNLTQLVKQATRVPDVEGHTANCLDLFLTSDPDRYSTTISSPLGSSDHCVIKTVAAYFPPDSNPQTTRRIWRYKWADWDEMRHFFSSYPWRQICFSSDDPTACATAVADVIRQAMEYFIPFSETTASYKSRPWFDAVCKRAESKKHLAYLNWANARAQKSSDIHAKKKAFNKATKMYKKALREARFKRIRHIGSKLVSYPSGSKAFWTLAKAVENSFCRTSLPPLLKPNGSLAHSAKEKADLFASLFAKNSHLDASQLSPPSLPHCGYHMPEIRIKQKEVLKLLRNLDVDKASGPDGIPALVLRNCAPELSPILTRLYRLSYSTGVVPESWKIANVQPIPKKGSRADPNNYRPISITSILGKVMERLLNKNLMLYLEGNDLLSDHQYGFRRNRSTGDLLVHMTHTIGQAIDGQGEALAVSLDISKAFDRVWHESLLCKLPSFGICPDLCTWISNFLRNRSFQVTVEGCSSDIHLVNAGVPQGETKSIKVYTNISRSTFGII